MTITVPATSANLGPGFDTLGLAIDLHNKVVVKKSDFFSISIKGEGSNRPSLKTNNQFVNIFYNFYNKLAGKKHNFRFEFYNSIPLSRGLGSSSAVIIAAISAAYEEANIKLPKYKILNKALFYESHPDNIAPAIYGGFTTSLVLNNKKVYTQRKKIPSYLKAIMVIPDRPMSTAQSRTKLPKTYPIKDIVFNMSRSSILTAAFFNEDWKMLKIASEDRLHQYIRMKSLSELFEVQKTALANGALMSTLSGSGSSFFNLAYENDARNLENKLKEKFPQFRVKSFDFNNKGLEVTK